MKGQQILSLLFYLICSDLFGQKHDFNWLIGYSSKPKMDSVIGHTMLRFSTNSGNLEFQFDKTKNIQFFGNAHSLSDKNGNYLMSFSGFLIEDQFGNKVLNSDSICYYDECYANTQQSVILPIPGQDSLYGLITVHDYYLLNQSKLIGGLISLTNLKVSVNGSIIPPEPKLVLFRDSFDLSKITACKHANGRDWWIIMPKDSQNVFLTMLLTPNGISESFLQEVSYEHRLDGDGTGVFSPDGKYYTLITSSYLTNKPKGSVDFYHFDRCTGILSQHIRRIFVSSELEDYFLIVGGAFSTDSRFLYACEDNSLFQFPISEDGILGEGALIDIYDGYLSYLFGGNYGSTNFRKMQLAPDGKIYCNTTYGITREYHVINKPNLLGKACDFQQHSLRMPALKYSSPSFPNYRLGPIDGSNCDTLGIDNIPWCWWRYNQDTSNHLCFEFTDLSAYEVAEWYWSFGDGTQDRDTSPIHCFPKNGIYEVCLIVKNKYGADTLCRTLNIGSTGIIDVDLRKIKIELFPNPVHDDLVINLEDYIPERMEVQLINLEGSRILKQRIYQGSNVINIEELVEGVYLVNIFEQGVLIKSEKMIKE